MKPLESESEDAEKTEQQETPKPPEQFEEDNNLLEDKPQITETTQHNICRP